MSLILSDTNIHW